MNIFEIVKLATKSLKVNKGRSLLTVLGVVIGVSSVIILVSIISGLGKTIRTELNSFGANLLFVFPGSAGGGRGPGGVVSNRLEFRFADLLQSRVPEISEVVTSIQSVGTASYKNRETKDTTVYAVTGNYFKALNIDVIEGRSFSENEGGNVAVIGITLKKELFRNVSPIDKEVIVKERRFKVIGVQKERGSIFGRDMDNVALIPLSEGRSLMGVDRPNAFFVKIFEDKNVDTAKVKMERVLLKEMQKDDFTVATQADTIELVGTILGVLSVGLGGVAAISLIVGGVGIMNIMYVSVTERTREIGLRKALGARREDILNQFLIEAIVLSIMGGLLGVILGMLISVGINRILATEINFAYVVLAFGFSVVIGIVFGVAPAIRASKLSPIDALRYE